MNAMSDIATLLQAAGRAEPGSVDRLFVVLYDDLQRLARAIATLQRDYLAQHYRPGA